MKNILRAALLLAVCAAMLLCGASCGKGEYKYKIGPPPSDFDNGVDFVRAGKVYDETDVPTYVVEEMDELKLLYSILPNDYAVYSYDISGNTDFSTYTYDEDFFKTHAMVLARTYCFTGSSSIRYSATCTRQGDVLVIHLEDNSEPDMCYTCDIGWHTLLIPVPRETLDGVTEIKCQ